MALKADASQWEEMSPAQKRAVENEIRDFMLGGISLEVRNDGVPCLRRICL